MGFAESSKAQTVFSMEVTDGTLTSGDQTTTYREDGEELLITEVAADPGFAVIFTFSGIRVLSKYANQIRVNLVGWYEGASGHDVQVQLWNYVTEAWESMTGDAKDLPDETAPDDYQFAIDVGDYMQVERFKAYVGYDREVKVRLYHDDTGNVLHDLHIDQIYVDFPTVGTDRHRDEIAHA